MTIKDRALALLVLTITLLGPNSHLAACGIVCAPLPKKTAVDHLLESETVVLARENSRRPFSYMTVEVLIGETVDGAIDLFLDSSTRRRLRAYPSDSVMLGRSNDGKWFRIGYVDTTYESIIREILEHLPAWQNKPVWTKERFLFFVDLLGHENRQIHELAYIEVGRAPYREIRNLRNVVSRESIYRELSDYRYREWHPLYLLMLGTSDNNEDCSYLSGKLDRSQNYSSVTNLSAVATAYIECMEEEAIAKLEALYFHPQARTMKEVGAIQAALSEHGSGGHRHLRNAIVSSYAVLLDNYPQAASKVAQDLLAWKRTELTDRLAEILDNQFASNPLGGYHIRMYLKQSEAGSGGK